MILKLLRIFTIILSFFFLTGFISVFSILGPGMTVLTSGNIYKAGAQFIINQRIEKETGKNSLTLIKEEINKNLIKEEIKKNNSLNEDLRQLVEKRIEITRQKLENQNLQKLVKKRITVTRLKLNLNNINQ
ncbi:hypothetical protein OAZ05_01625 [Candidatus Pelagibacter sp.]|nr:hypothetical protein [Candidatus Pelagibacter sp.]